MSPKQTNEQTNKQTRKQKPSVALENLIPEVLPALPAQAPTWGSSPPRGPVEEVFTAWAATQLRPTTVKFTDDRRRLIAKWLKLYPVADLVAAVQGWQHSPFHCGENEHGTVYNDIKLLLRDAAHIERFRDLWHNGPQQRPSRAKLLPSSQSFLEPLPGEERRR
jgi:hypothetical protein